MKLVHPGSFFGMALFGAFQDLQCTPLEDGSPRFASHADYVSQYTTQVHDLVSQRFLLQEDADRLIAQASTSTVGDPIACTGEPVLLPATGPANQLSTFIQFLTVISVLIVGIDFGIRRLKRKPQS